MVVEKGLPVWGYVSVLLHQDCLCDVMRVVHDTGCAGDDADGEIGIK